MGHPSLHALPGIHTPSASLTRLCLRIEDRVPAAHVSQDKVVLAILVPQVKHLALARVSALRKQGTSQSIRAWGGCITVHCASWAGDPCAQKCCVTLFHDEG